MKLLFSMGKAFWRSGGATGAGATFAAFSGSPWGMILTPILIGLSKGIKKYYQQRGNVPTWVGFIPF